MRFFITTAILLVTLGKSGNTYQSDEYDISGEAETAYRGQDVNYAENLRPVQTRQENQIKRRHQTYAIKDKNQRIEEEEIEQEEPDKLSLLLEKSTFNCNGKVTGYYADESLGCEVFHYCQENQRHSWICPEGFNFHQVHLICMPPSGENICEDSSKYHVVNEYLYKPINVEEHQTRPNVTLRYSERYYPDVFYHDEQNYRIDRSQSHKQPVQVGLPSSAQQPRKPISHQQSQNPYRFSTTPSSVYRSPEEINISLQQRRPQYFLTTPSKYSEEEYSYEK